MLKKTDYELRIANGNFTSSFLSIYILFYNNYLQSKTSDNMNILGIETATERLSAVLLVNGTLYQRNTDSRSSHCELLTGFIMELIEESPISINDIGGIAVSVGPGSFTGLRIGIATAMGLAYGLGIKAAGINTLMGLAWNTAASSPLVCPLIDAKRSQVYTAIYRTTDSLPAVVMEPSAVSMIKLAEILKTLDEPVTITGPFAEQFRKIISGINKTSISFIKSDFAKPSAESIARLGSIIFQRGESVNPAAIKPLYLRRSDAEIARDTSV